MLAPTQHPSLLPLLLRQSHPKEVRPLLVELLRLREGREGWSNCRCRSATRQPNCLTATSRGAAAASDGPTARHGPAASDGRPASHGPAANSTGDLPMKRRSPDAAHDVNAKSPQANQVDQPEFTTQVFPAKL